VHRFIALAWNVADPERTAVAEEVSARIRAKLATWTGAFEADGLMVLHSGAHAKASRVYELDRGAGVVLGTLFRRGSEEEAIGGDAFGPRETGLILEARGRHLAVAYWGRYVSFLHHRTGKKVLVFRDPSGAFPCFTFRHRGIDVFFSRMEDICSLSCFSFSVNWRYVASHLLFDQLRSRTTGLEGVFEILPGECIETDGDSKNETFLWHPAAFCHDAPIEDASEAARALRKTVSTCVSAWASCYDTILHELSGGLDSSIVLACLSRTSTRAALTCINLYSERPEGDERSLARAVAGGTGFPLVERPIRPSETTLRRMLNVPRIARPHISAIGLIFEDVYIDAARERDADAFFSGQGGDHLFHQRKTPLIAADYVRRHGLGPNLFRIVADTARSTGLSAWTVLHTVLMHGVLRRPSPTLMDLDRTRSFLDPGVLAAIADESLLHSWLETCGDMPPAKRTHLADLINLQSYYIPFGRAEIADLVYPLVSQPLIELCLSIPSYVLTQGGRDRALARRAFADMLPEPIIRRETKGDATHFYNDLLAREIGFVRELLLDGLLAKEKLVDRGRLERRLTHEQVMRGEEIFQILVFAGVEAWARAWRDRPVKAIA